MRITIINQFYWPDISPTANLAASLAEHLSKAGHEVSVIASRGGYVKPASGNSGSVPSDQSQNSVKIYRIWTPQLGKKTIIKRCIDYAIFYLLAAWRSMRLPAQDVIISLTTPPYIAWTSVFHRWLHRRTRLVLWNMDCYPDVAEIAGPLKKGGIVARVMRAFNRALFRRLDHLVCLDGAMAHLLLSQYGPKTTLPTTVIPNWEPAAKFLSSELSTKGTESWPEASTLGLSGKFVVLYSGNIGVGHRFETVLEAAKALRNDPVIFLFIGGGKRRQWVEDAKNREQLDNVILHDYVPMEMVRAVRSTADCALITLSNDMLGVMSPSKLHSNLAMSLPILYVGPQGSNVDEAISRYACGASIREGDVRGIVTFIKRAVAEPDKYQTLRRAARRAFEAAYVDNQTLPHFQDLIESMARRNVPDELKQDKTVPL